MSKGAEARSAETRSTETRSTKTRSTRAPRAEARNAKSPAPLVLGCAALVLTEAEKVLFTQAQPAGFILFQRNCDNPKQVQALIAELKSLCAHPALILIDQEGGKVARLRPPHWQTHSPACDYGTLYQQDEAAACQATYEGAQKIGKELQSLGINVNCFPVLDIPTKQADSVIGTRAYGNDAKQVADLAAAACGGLKSAGVLPMLKHIPGHGRAEQDSHFALPLVDESADTLTKTDFYPFHHLKDELLAMTAHIVYKAFDEALPATFSKRIINEIVRTQIGFRGLLLSDDIGMEALGGALSSTLPKRVSKALAAGCDIVLHCSGKFDEMAEIAKRLPVMTDQATARWQKVLEWLEEQ